jgi:hypothetical protein
VEQAELDLETEITVLIAITTVRGSTQPWGGEYGTARPLANERPRRRRGCSGTS